MTPKELIKILEANGWVQERSKGSHAIFKHPTNPALAVVPIHKKDMKIGTVNQILKMAGLK